VTVRRDLGTGYVPAMKLGSLGVLSCLLAACSSGGSSAGGGAGSGAPAPAASPASTATPGALAGSGVAAAGSAAPGAGAAAPGSQTDPQWAVPAGWRTEVIPFPLDFAPTVEHQGQEVLRFPPGFLDPASGDYWSYAFVWRTEDPAELGGAALGTELTAYFRGLIAAVDQKQRIQARDEIVARAEPDGAGRFRLTVHAFDAFKTAAPIDLTGWAQRRPCRAGALWMFVLAPEKTAIRAQLDELARGASCPT
jgi:hypothetical protein